MLALPIHADWTEPACVKVLYSWVDALHPGVWMNNPQGTLGKMEDGVIRGYSQGQAARMMERRGAGSTDTNHSGPAGTSMGKQPEEHVLWVQISTTTQQGRAQLPSSVPAMPEQGQLLPQPLLCTVAILPQKYSLLLFLFKHPGKYEADCTLPYQDPEDFLVYQWGTLSA